jgi:hypothetical protein
MDVAKHLMEHLSPLRWILYAYALNSGEASAVARILGIENPPDGTGAWALYAAETDQLICAGPLSHIAKTLDLDSCAYTIMKLALSSELLPAYRAVLDGMGGLTLDLALRLYSSSPEEAIGWRAVLRQKGSLRSLFGNLDANMPLRLCPAVLDVCLGASPRLITHNLEELAQRIERGGYSWDDLIIPAQQKELLRHICDRVSYGGTVYGEWEMDANAAYSRGVRALFSGPPGTGKTMAAQVIARELDTELYIANLSSLVSKYIGETEKNLESIFNEAAKSGGILFFDEADALFGKRGEQKDSHDRYANMQTAFLLQCVESYSGTVLLATNLMSNLDPAFLRRIHVRVEFPSPDKELRRQIWEKYLLYSDAPLSEDIDIPYLAETFDLTGSAIRNTALTAAFMAAADGGVIGMKELVRALAVEYGKLDKVLTARELGEYTEYIIP